MKLCKDCAHYAEGMDYGDYCGRRKAGIDPVSGKEVIDWTEAYTERSAGIIYKILFRGRCGINAKYFKESNDQETQSQVLQKA